MKKMDDENPSSGMKINEKESNISISIRCDGKDLRNNAIVKSGQFINLQLKNNDKSIISCRISLISNVGDENSQNLFEKELKPCESFHYRLQCNIWKRPLMDESEMSEMKGRKITIKDDFSRGAILLYF